MRYGPASPGLRISGMSIESTGQDLFQQAREALELRLPYFAPQLNTEFYRLGATTTSTQMKDWQHYLHVIDSAGWDLVHWVVLKDSRDHPTAYPVFVPKGSVA